MKRSFTRRPSTALVEVCWVSTYRRLRDKRDDLDELQLEVDTRERTSLLPRPRRAESWTPRWKARVSRWGKVRKVRISTQLAKCRSSRCSSTISISISKVRISLANIKARVAPAAAAATAASRSITCNRRCRRTSSSASSRRSSPCCTTSSS